MTRAMGSRVAVSAAAHLACEGITGLRVEGFGPSVDARCRELSRELTDVGSAEVREGEGSQAFWRRVRALDMLPIAGHELWRVSLPPAKGWILTDALQAAGARCIADWAGGLIWAALPDAVADSRETLIQDLSATQGGYAALVRASSTKRRASHGAPKRDAPGSDLGLQALQSHIKRAFDPLGILNPGLQLGAVS
jgi:glycolate oxidase FAD binding subunit